MKVIGAKRDRDRLFAGSDKRDGGVFRDLFPIGGDVIIALHDNSTTCPQIRVFGVLLSSTQANSNKIYTTGSPQSGGTKPSLFFEKNIIGLRRP